MSNMTYIRRENVPKNRSRMIIVIDAISKQNLAKRLDLMALQLKHLYMVVLNSLFIFVLCSICLFP